MNLKIFITEKLPVQHEIDGVMVDYISVIFDVADTDTDRIIESLAFQILAKTHPNDKMIKQTASNWIIEHDLFSKYEAKSYQEYLAKVESRKYLRSNNPSDAVSVTALRERVKRIEILLGIYEWME